VLRPLKRPRLTRNLHIDSWSPFYNFREFGVWLLTMVICAAGIYFGARVFSDLLDGPGSRRGLFIGGCIGVLGMRVANLRVTGLADWNDRSEIIDALVSRGYQPDPEETDRYRPVGPKWLLYDGNFVILRGEGDQLRVSGPLFLIRRL